jgi:hypothetical protein
MNAQQKAELFADYLEQIFELNEQESRKDQLIVSQENPEISFVMPKEVANEIKRNTNPRKAPQDLIYNR